MTDTGARATDWAMDARGAGVEGAVVGEGVGPSTGVLLEGTVLVIFYWTTTLNY